MGTVSTLLKSDNGMNHGIYSKFFFQLKFVFTSVANLKQKGFLLNYFMQIISFSNCELATLILISNIYVRQFHEKRPSPKNLRRTLNLHLRLEPRL